MMTTELLIQCSNGTYTQYEYETIKSLKGIFEWIVLEKRAVIAIDDQLPCLSTLV